MSSPRSHRVRNLALAAILLLSTASLAWAHGARHPAAPLAQHLVERLVAQHANVHEAGIVAETGSGCFNIASTDKGDLGERCEADDSAPLKTGKPSVGKEEGGYAVSLPLLDRAGKQVGALGVEFRKGAFSQPDQALAAARSIAAELEPQIPSKAALLAQSTSEATSR